MRSDDEEENDYDEDEDEDEEEMQDDGDAEMDVDVDGDMEVDAGEDDGEVDSDDDSDEGDGDGDGDGDGGGDEEGEEDDDDEEEEEGDGDGDDDDEEDEEDDDDDDEDEEEDDDDDADVDEEVSSEPSQTTPRKLPPPPHMIRRTLFKPAFVEPPSSLSIEAVVGIPLPSAVHSIAATSCLSYLLTGSQDGHVRCYDFWPSVNGAQVMTAPQRTVVGLGEGVSKAGVGRGWWSCEVESDGLGARRTEPVFSLACEGDGLWALAGSQSGPINLYTLRHSPGHLVHSLKGHTNVVSCLQLLPGEKSLLSGSWDGTIREWDLNTGQAVRRYPTHGTQISSISLRPLTASTSTSSSPRSSEGPRFAVSVGPDFFTVSKPNTPQEGPPGPDGLNERDVTEQPSSDPFAPVVEGTTTTIAVPSPAPPPDSSDDTLLVDPQKSIALESTLLAEPEANGDVVMAEVEVATPASYDPLFDDDEGEVAPKPTEVSIAHTPNGNSTGPAPLAAPSRPPSVSARPPPLSLPGVASKQSPSSSSATPRLFNPTSASGQPSSSRVAAATIPILSPTEYRSFSDDILLTSSMDGQVTLIDRRVPSRSSDGVHSGVGRLLPGDRAPPWCMSATWLGDGNQVLAGRRNGTIDIWDVRKSSSSTAPNLLRTLRTPSDSGPVSSIVAFPDGRHVATASQDNVRLWPTVEYYEPDESMKRSRSRPPFRIIAGHHGGIISSMIVDPTCRFLITASGDRGWQGESTKVVLIHEVKW